MTSNKTKQAFTSCKVGFGAQTLSSAICFSAPRLFLLLPRASFSNLFPQEEDQAGKQPLQVCNSVLEFQQPTSAKTENFHFAPEKVLAFSVIQCPGWVMSLSPSQLLGKGMEHWLDRPGACVYQCGNQGISPTWTQGLGRWRRVRVPKTYIPRYKGKAFLESKNKKCVPVSPTNSHTESSSFIIVTLFFMSLMSVSHALTFGSQPISLFNLGVSRSSRGIAISTGKDCLITPYDLDWGRTIFQARSIFSTCASFLLCIKWLDPVPTYTQ